MRTKSPVYLAKQFRIEDRMAKQAFAMNYIFVYTIYKAIRL
jgi:hypothetical protein